MREARAAATLDHPHICAVYEVGEADGHVFIAMQLVEGQTLDARLRQGPLELADTLAIAVQIVDALCQAHEHGILHRDIKPANVMLTARGQAKVMDFGLAKLTGASGQHGDTQTESVVERPGRDHRARCPTCRRNRCAAPRPIAAAICSASACCCTRW